MRSTNRALLLAMAAALAAAALPADPAHAQQSRQPPAQATTERGPAAEVTAQARRRPATRLRIDRQSLPPSAVRTCDAAYVQEFRPSGPVIVPRMRCRWIAG